MKNSFKKGDLVICEENTLNRAKIGQIGVISGINGIYVTLFYDREYNHYLFKNAWKIRKNKICRGGTIWRKL